MGYSTKAKLLADEQKKIHPDCWKRKKTVANNHTTGEKPTPLTTPALLGHHPGSDRTGSVSDRTGSVSDLGTITSLVGPDPLVTVTTTTTTTAAQRVECVPDIV